MGFLIFIFVIAIVIVIIAFCTSRSQNYENHSYYDIPDIRSKEYRIAIYNNIPSEYKQNIQLLNYKIEQLEVVINRTNQRINEQSINAVKDVLERANDAENKITNYWNRNKKKADFYYYIGLHFASFTLADKLTSELDTLRKVRSMLTSEIKATQSDIDFLAEKINNFSSNNLQQIKKEHKELCQKCNALRNTRKFCNEQILICKKLRDNQNILTGQRRDYIGANFGQVGRNWRKRIMTKHNC